MLIDKPTLFGARRVMPVSFYYVSYVIQRNMSKFLVMNT